MDTRGGLRNRKGEDVEKDREDIIKVLVEGRKERVGRKMKNLFELFLKHIQDNDVHDVPR